MQPFIQSKDHPVLEMGSKFGVESLSGLLDVYLNDIYEVWVYRKKMADFLVHNELFKGKCTYLSIKRKDKKALHDWRHFQLIKNELVGEEIEAIELYPAESRLHDTANQFHLFCNPMGTKVKFGWNFRDVDYVEQIGGHNKLGQRGKV